MSVAEWGAVRVASLRIGERLGRRSSGVGYHGANAAVYKVQLPRMADSDRCIVLRMILNYSEGEETTRALKVRCWFCLSGYVR